MTAPSRWAEFLSLLAIWSPSERLSVWLLSKAMHSIKVEAHPLRRGTRHAERPQADFIVFPEKDGWYVSYAMKEFGPHPKACALAGAIRTAKIAERSGRAARVREEQRDPLRFTVLWPKP